MILNIYKLNLQMIKLSKEGSRMQVTEVLIVSFRGQNSWLATT